MPSLRSLVLLFDKHASGELSDYEVSSHLHLFDGAGVLPVPGGDHRTEAQQRRTPDKVTDVDDGTDVDGSKGQEVGAGRDLQDCDGAAAAEPPSAAGPAAPAAEVDVIPDSEEDVTDDASAAAPEAKAALHHVENACGQEMTLSRDIDTTFPPPTGDGRFSPSPFQRALLRHVAGVRRHVGHCTGLLVMATALGKTGAHKFHLQSNLTSDGGDLEWPVSGH
jgi:hypothetical protein